MGTAVRSDVSKYFARLPDLPYLVHINTHSFFSLATFVWLALMSVAGLCDRAESTKQDSKQPLPDPKLCAYGIHHRITVRISE